MSGQKGKAARDSPSTPSIVVEHGTTALQVLGRNLEGTITKAEDIKKEWKDDFTSVEHLVLAMLDDTRFGRKLLRDAGLDAAKLTQAIKDIRGGNRVQDQVPAPLTPLGRASSHARALETLYHEGAGQQCVSA